MSSMNIRHISLAALLIALGVVIAPLIWFPILASKAYPGQHMINALAGVLLGPLWASVIAIFIGLIRMSLGIGTIFSMPGGIPGALMVGLFQWLLKKRSIMNVELAALAEPIGTVFIGGTLAVYLVAPMISRNMVLIPVWIGWSLSCIPGAIIGFVILKSLRSIGIIKYFFPATEEDTLIY